MADQTKQRIQIETRNGITVYSADAWPGWQDIANTCFAFLMISLLFAVLLFMMYQVRRILNGFVEYEWLNVTLSILLSGCFDFSLTLTLGFILLFIPYYLLYQLCPKQFWIADDCLYHRVRLAGLMTRTRRIPFERLLEISIGACCSTSRRGNVEKTSSVYSLKAVYEMKMPKWLFVILVYWNEKFTQWPLGLVNGIGTKEEAEKLKAALLEPMTASPVCKIGS